MNRQFKLTSVAKIMRANFLNLFTQNFKVEKANLDILGIDDCDSEFES